MLSRCAGWRGRPAPILMRLHQQGYQILRRNVGRNLDAFDQLPHEEIDFMQLAPAPIANVHFNLMDEMLVAIIHDQAQRLNSAAVAGPLALTTLATIGLMWSGTRRSAAVNSGISCWITAASPLNKYPLNALRAKHLPAPIGSGKVTPFFLKGVVLCLSALITERLTAPSP